MSQFSRHYHLVQMTSSAALIYSYSVAPTGSERYTVNNRVRKSRKTLGMKRVYNPY